MNATQTKHALLICRPRAQDKAEPEIARAIQVARADAAVEDWFQRHLRFQEGMQRSFRELPVPAGLAANILARRRIVQIPWWRKPAILAAAAVIALLLGGMIWQKNKAPRDTFSIFRSRMIGNVLRQYNMDIVTNDAAVIHQFLVQKQAPADYELPPGLSGMPLAGAGVLGWASNRVSMICLQAPGPDTLFLFVVDQASIRPVPPATPQFVQVNSVMTASWSQGGKSYVLATTNSVREFLQRHF